MHNFESIFSEFLKKNCLQEHILKNSYPHIHFTQDTFYLEFTPQFLKLHHDYYQDEPESVSFDMTNELEQVYGDLLFCLNLQSQYDSFIKNLKLLSDKISKNYIDTWEDINFDGYTESHYLYSVPVWQPIETFLTKEMKEVAQKILEKYINK